LNDSIGLGTAPLWWWAIAYWAIPYISLDFCDGALSLSSGLLVGAVPWLLPPAENLWWYLLGHFLFQNYSAFVQRLRDLLRIANQSFLQSALCTISWWHHDLTNILSNKLNWTACWIADGWQSSKTNGWFQRASHLWIPISLSSWTIERMSEWEL
jgi:hypothetical protein